MRTTLVLCALAVTVIVGARCKRVNGAYCDDGRPCPSGFACDLTARECYATAGGGDLAGVVYDMAGCSCGGTTPICVAMSCVSCLSTSDPEGACAAVSPSTPHCLTSGGDAGSCVACRDSNDCSAGAPFCDSTTHVCRGCIADAECPSLVCDLTPTSTTRGTCIATSNVVYADAVAGNDTNSGLSPAAATKTMQKAVNIAVGLNPARRYVRAAAGMYNESNGVGVNNKTIYIVGANGAIVHTTAGGKDALGAQGGGSLTVRNLVATADNGNGGNCNNASFTAYQTKFINSQQLGVVSSGCTPLLLDGCTVSGNMQGGVTVLGGDFTIMNSVIAKNSGGPGMNQTGIGANTIFVNNTVADNTSGGINVGVTCVSSGTIMLVNTILYNNRGGANTLSESNCSGSFIATDDVSAGPQSTVDLTMQAPGFVGGGDYHLAAGSPCINEGTNLYNAPDHDIDFQPRPDAVKKLWDIGADEAQ